MTYYAVIDTNVLVSALLSSHENAATVQVVSRLFLIIQIGILITFYTVYNADFRNYFSKMPLYRIL